MAGQPLVLRFSTDLEGAQRSVANFASSVVDRMSEVGDASTKASSNLDSLGSAAGAVGTRIASQMRGIGASVDILTSAFKGLVSAAAIGALITAFGKAEESLAAMSKQAQETRLSVEELAAIKFVGAGFGASNEDINNALTFFTSQSKKTQEDARALYVALDQIGPEFRKAFADAPTQADRLNVISKAMGSTSDETKRAQLAMGAFGTDNERVMATVDSMNGSLSTLVERAQAAGISVSTDLAERADDAQKKLAVLREIIADKLTIALVNIAEIIKNTVVPSFSGLLPFIENTRAEIEKIAWAFNVLSAAASLYAATGHLPLPSEAAAQARGADYVEPGSNPEERPLNVGPNRSAFTPRANLGKKPSEVDDEYDREEKRINKQINALSGQAAAVGKVGEAAARAEASTRLWEAADEAKLAHTPELTKKIDELADKYAKVKNNLEQLKLAADLAFEAQQLGRTSDEQSVSSRLRGSNIDPESEAGQRLANQMRTIQSLTEGKEMASSFVKGLISDLENGVKAGKALENQLKKIADKLLDKTLDSLISGLFKAGGGLFGGLIEVPKQAEGGWAGDGPRALVPASAFIGARHFAAGGGIPAILHPGEIVLNAAQQKNVAGSMTGQGAQINLTHAPVINGTGLSAEQVFTVIQRSQADFARRIGPIFSDWQRRHG